MLFVLNYSSFIEQSFLITDIAPGAEESQSQGTTVPQNAPIDRMTEKGREYNVFQIGGIYIIICICILKNTGILICFLCII